MVVFWANHPSSLDDETVLSDALNSAKDFLARLDTPALIDEVQKAPHDKSLVPILNLNVLSEKSKTPRFSSEEFSAHARLGGMPVPMFIRENESRSLYWQGWLSTILLRDLSRLFKRGFDADFATQIFEQLGRILKNGDLPTTAHFSVRSPAKLKRYLLALESIFVLKRLTCHERGIGKDIWMLCDSGLANYLTRDDRGEGSTLSLMRHALWNEIAANFEYNNDPALIQYFKSAKGSEVEFVVQGTPIRIVPLADVNSGAWGWYEKALIGASKKLKSKTRIMAAPVAKVYRDGETLIVPWSIWS